MRTFRTAFSIGLCLVSLAAWPQTPTRVILGNTQSLSLVEVADDALVKRIATLRAQAENLGTTRLIVGLRVPFAPEGGLSGTEQLAQLADIRAAQDHLLNQIPTLSKTNGSLKRFDSMPFIAAEVSLNELDSLLRMPEVTSVHQDKIHRHQLTESVPLIGASSGTFSGYNGNGQTVAILDTGVDKAHPDLSSRVVSEACYSTTSVTYSSQTICPGGGSASTAMGSALPYASGVCPAGSCDHGTHVAAIAAGAKGVARGANIIAIQVFSKFPAGAYCGATACALSFDSDQIAGLERVYALRNNHAIAVVNMSLGGGQYFSQALCDADNAPTKVAIDNLRSVGIATVIASGNSGYTSSMGSPGCISTAVSVGATGDGSGGATQDQVMSYSNSASFLNLLAPGSKITAAIPNNSYGTWDGTSMATPHVAGAWAVLKSKKPSATVDQVLFALTSSGQSVTDSRNSLTKPRIQVTAAANSLGTGSKSIIPALMLLLN